MKESARPAHAALNLVENQQRPGLVASLAKSSLKFRRGCHESSLSLQGLDQNGGRLFCDLRGEILAVVKRQKPEPRNQGLEGGTVFFRRGRRKRPESSTVKRSREGDDFDSVGLAFRLRVGPGDFDRGFHGFRSAVLKENAVLLAEFRELRRKRPGVRMMEQIRDMKRLLTGFLENRRDHRVAVAQRVAAHAGNEVEIFFAVVRE